jgi:hypothetical protein
MNCCVNCFMDENLIDFIDRDGYVLGDCDFCQSKNEEICDLNELCEYFKHKLSSLFSLYDSPYVTHFQYQFGNLKNNDTDDKNDLLSLIQIDWNVFNLDILTENNAYKLLYEIKKYIDVQYTPFRNVTIDNMKENVWFRDMAGYFHKNHWDVFKEILLHDFRFFPFKSRKLDIDLEKTMDFELFSMSSSILWMESILYRGRVHTKKTDTPYDKSEMLIPDNDIITNGRANPIGINYLYLANNIETVFTEVRAWKNGQISVATIEINEDLHIVDLTNEHKLLRRVSAFDKESNILLQSILAYNDLMDIFAEEISRPINPNESTYGYILTQFICEKIKTFNKDDKNPTFDGIKFKSAVGDGINYILFSDEKVTVNDVDLYAIKDIEVNYSYEKVK